MLSEISRDRRPMGHSSKSLCEIGLKTPSNIYEKTSDVGLLGGVESSVWSSERLEAVLLGFWAASVQKTPTQNKQNTNRKHGQKSGASL